MSAPEGGPVRIGDRYRVEERIGSALWARCGGPSTSY